MPRIMIKGGIWKNTEVNNEINPSRRELHAIIGRDIEGGSDEVRQEPVGQDSLSPPQEVRQAVQGQVVRVAGPQHQEGTNT